MWLSDPNSPEGLRYRADRLVKKHGLSYQHPAVSALLVQADLKENEPLTKWDWLALIISLSITTIIGIFLYKTMFP